MKKEDVARKRTKLNKMTAEQRNKMQENNTQSQEQCRKNYSDETMSSVWKKDVIRKQTKLKKMTAEHRKKKCKKTIDRAKHKVGKITVLRNFRV